MATDDLKARFLGFAAAWRANRQNGDEIYEINHHTHGNQCVRASDLTGAVDAIATLEAQLAAKDDLKARVRAAAEFQYTPASAEQVLEAACGIIATLEAQLAAYHAALQYIADATDLYEPCGWAVNSARTAINRKDEA